MEYYTKSTKWVVSRKQWTFIDLEHLKVIIQQSPFQISAEVFLPDKVQHHHAMEGPLSCRDSGTDITNKNVIHYHTIVILPQSDFDFSWAAQCSLLTVLKWTLLIMVIIGIFWISIKIRNIFVVFVESMKETRKGQGPSDLPNYFQRFQKALRFSLRCRLTCYDLMFFVEILTSEKSLFFLIGPVEYSSSNSFE